MTLINDKIEIDPSRPLPEYDTAFAKAYAARPKGAQSGSLVALVAPTPYPLRHDLVSSERALIHPTLMPVRDCGAVLWPPTNGRAFAFAYEKPLGQRIAPLGGGAFTPLHQDEVIKKLVPNLTAGLGELARLAIFHGSIRADNVYLESGENGRAMLGDHLAHPIGFAQPVLYETIDRGLATPFGRGTGTTADDLYALGVTILVALLGDAPLKELGDDAIVQLKMERGSYTALVGERRFGGGLTELLRSLLVDDPAHRWTIADLGLWLQGRRQMPKQAMAAKKASRPFRFNGQEFWTARQLAQGLSADTKQAAALIRNEELTRWLKSGLADEDRIHHLAESLVAARRQRSGPEDERLVTHAIMVLDPTGPIRYRGLSLLPAGMPTLLADMILQQAPTQIINELILNGLPTQWLTGLEIKRPDLVAAVQMCEHAKEAMEKPVLGFGIERALYELNPTMPCVSLAVRDAFCMTVRQLLDTLDKRARDSGLIDRHIAAFMLARDRKIMGAVMRVIEQAKTVGERGLALMTLYADLQYRLGTDKLTGIAAVLMPMLEEAAKRFKNINRQEKARKDLRVVAAEGNIGAMLKLVDDPDLLERDRQEYAVARTLFVETENEITRMEAYARNRKVLAIQAGEPLAAVIAIILAFVLAVAVLLRVMIQ
jgi:hypothetical protein